MFTAYALTWYSVFGVRPVRLLEKVPVPVPSRVLLSAVVGLAPVLQHTPREVTAAPPAGKAVPPLVAEVVAMKVTAVVVTISGGDVVKLTSAP